GGGGPEAPGEGIHNRPGVGRRLQVFLSFTGNEGGHRGEARSDGGAVEEEGGFVGRRREGEGAYSQRKKKSGRGAVWMMVGSGWPPGPKGPRKYAQAAIARRIAPEKMMSFPTPAGTKGMPSRWVSSLYSWRWWSAGRCVPASASR